MMARGIYPYEMHAVVLKMYPDKLWRASVYVVIYILHQVLHNIILCRYMQSLLFVVLHCKYLILHCFMVLFSGMKAFKELRRFVTYHQLA